MPAQNRRIMDGSKPPPQAANLHVSDVELLARVFTVDDPEALDGLVAAVPAISETPAIEFWYDVTPPRRHGRPADPMDRAFVPCVHCKASRHWRGYVMRSDAGERFLVGKDCGFNKLSGIARS